MTVFILGQMQAIDMGWSPSYSQDLSMKQIQESNKASQGYASSEHCSFVGGVSETINRVATVFLDLEKLPTWDKDQGEKLKA